MKIAFSLEFSNHLGVTHDVYLQSQTAWKFINRFDETSLTITSLEIEKNVM